MFWGGASPAMALDFTRLSLAPRKREAPRRAEVPTAMLAEQSAPLTSGQMLQIDYLSHPDMANILKSQVKCYTRLGSPAFQKYIKDVFQSAVRTNDLKVLHQLRICVAEWHKFICWYMPLIPLLVAALARREVGNYRVSSAEERFQWAHDIVKMIMEYTPDFGKEGADMRNATRQALARAGVPLEVRHQFLGNRWAPQTAQEPPCVDSNGASVAHQTTPVA